MISFLRMAANDNDISKVNKSSIQRKKQLTDLAILKNVNFLLTFREGPAGQPLFRFTVRLEALTQHGTVAEFANVGSFVQPQVALL